MDGQATGVLWVFACIQILEEVHRGGICTRQLNDLFTTAGWCSFIEEALDQNFWHAIWSTKKRRKGFNNWVSFTKKYMYVPGEYSQILWQCLDGIVTHSYASLNCNIFFWTESGKIVCRTWEASHRYVPRLFMEAPEYKDENHRVSIMLPAHVY